MSGKALARGKGERYPSSCLRHTDINPSLLLIRTEITRHSFVVHSDPFYGCAVPFLLLLSCPCSLRVFSYLMHYTIQYWQYLLSVPGHLECGLHLLYSATSLPCLGVLFEVEKAFIRQTSRACTIYQHSTGRSSTCVIYGFGCLTDHRRFTH